MTLGASKSSPISSILRSSKSTQIRAIRAFVSISGLPGNSFFSFGQRVLVCVGRACGWPLMSMILRIAAAQASASRIEFRVRRMINGAMKTVLEEPSKDGCRQEWAPTRRHDISVFGRAPYKVSQLRILARDC
jgi:hypothetical protein